LRRIITRVAVIIAVLVILWTITGFRADLCRSAVRADLPSTRLDRQHQRTRCPFRLESHDEAPPMVLDSRIATGSQWGSSV
jgi:hypothetical protein